MGMQHVPSWLLTLFITLVLLNTCSEASDADRQVHIVYLGQRLQEDFSAASLHLGILQQVLSGSSATESLVYSYRRSFNGFAAKLTQQEIEKLESMEGVVSIFPSQKKQLHTTRSWDFMGFTETVNRSLKWESDVVVGVIDTGIWPESASFSDEGFGPPPSKWKGTCQSSANFTCNKKLIGARFYKADKQFDPILDDPSPRDTIGHGTHTASTAAGRVVSDTSLFGLALGSARGAVPSARIAVYKVCWSDGCSDADMLAAFDDAIADGVDVISISIGHSIPLDYFMDSLAIGSFHAMKGGILTSISAGNDGPYAGSVTNVAPWTLTVAASSTDRKIINKVALGDGEILVGRAVNTFQLKGTTFPLIYGGDAPNTSAGYSSLESMYCSPNTLDRGVVKGKIVLCDIINKGEGALDANARGMIMRYDGYNDLAFSYPLPASLLNTTDGSKVYNYLKNSTSNSKVNILKSESIKDSEAPTVVSFSSRGPNLITPDILKPDLTAPGVDILAAWSPVASMSVFEGDKRSVKYNIISGTSMSCPHVSGAAAYVKSFNPTWSPAAIKSALMTTATPMSPTKNEDAEFAYGSGHIDPIKAVNPGLVYDAGEVDYVGMLCNQGYNTRTLRLVTGDNSTCSNVANGTVLDLNYPSFAYKVSSGVSFSATFSRTVTNVGVPPSVYNAFVNSASAFTVTVEPTQLSFKSIGEKKSFTVKVEGSMGTAVSASLVWSDGVHSVRSPIIVYVGYSSSESIEVQAPAPSPN
ncbi:cucumisin-like isoform X2 [Amborella trichopoda]|uniref:cucumisin-like isoform X2 n=1 Tax=Amborella trichopoda TaxID=13333 RepID=UPI0009BED0EB|nr:cucumisin-like isoform X2 [Amborella trichopoda]|eukprot:XP_020526609.1 cucumisin-like isoform X2 [Amborella trichopoda]